MTFEEAIAAAKAGKKVRRHNWGDVVAKFKRSNPAFGAWIWMPYKGKFVFGLASVKEPNKPITLFIPGPGDMLSDDWEIVE